MIMKDTNCQKHANLFDFDRCCDYPVPIPLDSEVNKMKGKSSCLQLQAFEQFVKFTTSDGKLIHEKVFNTFKATLLDAQSPPHTEWLKVLSESVDACQKISENIFVLVFKP
jgi:hypothetical protein